ncbi:MAG: hypothetical protein K6G49_00275 [Candidatus Saccharibacteria bacterium]|nr:hypothetical protein [Candidatus Saccharibacteria bacterium]
MVCIAAFIILAIVGIFVAVASIFKPKLWKSYTKALSKAWGCLWKKVRLQKCETGFKEDVKNGLLSRVMLKKPKLVKPLSIIIEVLSVIIVVVVIWAILTAIKSLLAIWVLGSCNVTKPSACSMGAEMCSIDEPEPTNALEATGRWFTEWGEIFEAIPDKFRSYNAEDYNFNYITVNDNATGSVAADIFDPGCSVCMQSYRNQKASGFFDQYNVRMVPLAIQDADNNYKFKNSEIVVRYMFAAEQVRSGLAMVLLDHIFTDRDDDGISYQNLFNEEYSHEEATAKLESWIKAEGVDDADVAEIRKITNSDEVTTKMQENREIVENQIKVKGIPTMIYDGQRHTGLYKAE